MKLSEHIAQCEAMLQEHGDLDVQYSDLSDDPDDSPAPSVDLCGDDQSPPRFTRHFLIGGCG